MKTLLSTDLESGILGTLEYTASADCARDGEDVVADNIKVSVFIPAAPGVNAKHLDVTHLISENELDVIGGKLIEAYWIQKSPDADRKYDATQTL